MSMFKFLPGILIGQAAAAVLVVAASGSPGPAHWLPLGVLAAIIAVLVAVWFGSIANHIKKDALAEASAAFARAREHLVVAAEVDKRAALEDSHRRIVQETNRAYAKANFKLGLGLAALLALGGALLAVEFVALGLVIFATAGGALAGYVARARQEARVARRREEIRAREKTAAPVLAPPRAGMLIEAGAARSGSARSDGQDTPE